MDRNHPEVLIEHIEEAKDWLDKAKSEYIQANPVRGEMILNLAQAEVKHAWELSRHRTVNSNIVTKEQKRTVSSHNNNYWLPVAASIIVLVGIIFSTKLVRINYESRNLATLPTPTGTVPKAPVENVLSKGIVDQVPHQLSVPKREVPKQIVSENDVSKESKSVILKPETKQHLTVAETEQSLPQVSVEPETKTKTFPIEIEVKKSESIAVSETKPRENLNRPVAVTNQPRLQPAVQLSIDEEALTREASHSLRNGK
ncbi:hypothetical protein EDC14_102757 [Hydrogenispora ethanolica]|jgi:hypothetical protein|uniref:Uncharacterized protein n=1 Tax=Hydrogenispora ethanolica TaxID=1082276 RepID=A0A4R1R957_HYDET|nr:hypothetical protein [Hydrogenispora ethanolica]TCL62206.1 hypothetical protein EDC14_102757 [Hydrogenispora ethanolica]